MSLKKSWENYKRPTPQKWRKAGDIALLLLLAWQPMVISAPFDDTVRWFLDVGVTTGLVLFKFWTNTNKEESI